MLGSREQAVYFSQGTPELSVDTTPYALGLLGKEVEINVGTAAAPNFRYYKYVKAGGTIGARSLVAWSTVALIGNTVVAQSASAPTNDAMFCGVSAADSSITSGQYFWIVLYRPGSTVQAAHNVATNATQSDTGLYWVLSAGSFGTRVTTFASNTSITDVRLVAFNISSMNSTNATASTTTATSGYFLFI